MPLGTTRWRGGDAVGAGGRSGVGGGGNVSLGGSIFFAIQPVRRDATMA